MLILASRAALNRHVRILNLNPEAAINWTCIENEVVSDFFVGNKLVHDLRTGFFEDGDVWVLGQVGSRGMGATEKIHHQTKVEPDHLKQIAMFVDEKHSNGNAVVACQIIALLLDKFGLMIHRCTVGRLMRKLGLNYSVIKPVKRTFAAHRQKVLRGYLIELDGNERRLKIIYFKSY